MKVPRVILAACALALLLAVGVAAARFFTHDYPLRDRFFNADNLTFTWMYDSLFERGEAFSRWHLSLAPSYVPDMLLAFLGRALTGSVYAGAAVTALVQILLTVWLGWRLLRRLLPPLEAGLFGTAGMMCLLLGLGAGTEPYLSIALVPYHWGIVLGELALLTLVIDGLETARPRLLLGAGLVCTALVMSDFLFLSQVVGPVVGSLAILAWRRRLAWSSVARLGGAILGGAALGYVLHHLITPNPFSLPFLDPGRPDLSILRGEARRLVDGSLLVVVLLGLAWVALVAGALRRKDPRPGALLLSWFPLLAVAATVAQLFLATTFPFPIRYAAPLLIGPFVLLGVSLHQLGARRLALVSAGLTIVVCLIGLARLMPRGKAWQGGEGIYPEAACLDALAQRTGASHGIAGYWMTKPLNLLASGDVELVAVRPDLQVEDALDVSGRAVARYDLAVLHHSWDGSVDLDARALPPAQETIHCGESTILYFGPGGLSLPAP